MPYQAQKNRCKISLKSITLKLWLTIKDHLRAAKKILRLHVPQSKLNRKPSRKSRRRTSQSTLHYRLRRTAYFYLVFSSVSSGAKIQMSKQSTYLRINSTHLIQSQSRPRITCCRSTESVTRMTSRRSQLSRRQRRASWSICFGLVIMTLSS